ncbi:restriction endonuclease subunit S [Nodosilinea sp. AN01ver1]|uniref:restriction endonuclease subunit S n=1 Tax=Nodosilinea sp. AN01ver1 TaxID=3423362 RepID=UPI003D3213FF
MGGYLAYSEYKESGVEWLGRIPAHWEVQRIKFLCQEIVAGPFGSSLTKDMYAPSGYKIYGQEQVIANDFTIGDYYVASEKYSEMERYTVLPGDLLVSCVGTFGKVAVVPKNAEKGIINPRLIKLRPDHSSVLSKYFGILLSSSISFFQFDRLSRGGTMGVVNIGILSELIAPLPSLKEQHQIATFLDYKTAQIDALIAKKEALLGKLAEKRTALISQAVTKGLDLTVPMKDSGIDWLGEIPAHWDTPPLYARYSIELGKMLHEGRITGDYLVPYLRNVDVQWDVINLHDLPEMDIRSHEYVRYLIRSGDLLICEGGEVGRTAIVPETEDLLAFQKALHRLRALSVEESPRFLFYTMFWAASLGVFLAGGNPNTIPHLTGEKLRLYRFPKPPLSEQEAISRFLDREIEALEEQNTQIFQAIAKLREYRTALITNAVTGKIDVRDLKLPAPIPAEANR